MKRPADELHKIQTILKFTLIIMPIIAGADKFTNLLTDWGKYLNPLLANIFPFSALVFMLTVGVIEIGAGLLVLINPIKGAYVLSVWFVLIALNLFANHEYTDIAIWDLVMAIVAYSFARITVITDIYNKQV